MQLIKWAIAAICLSPVFLLWLLLLFFAGAVALAQWACNYDVDWYTEMTAGNSWTWFKGRFKCGGGE